MVQPHNKQHQFLPRGFVADCSTRQNDSYQDAAERSNKANRTSSQIMFPDAQCDHSVTLVIVKDLN